MSALESFVRLVNSMNEYIGRFVSWFTLATVIICFVVVVLRYALGIGILWLQELYIWSHAIVFMAGAGYTMLHGGHVRVDIFYTNFTARKKGLVNAFGSIFLGLSFSWTILLVGMKNKSAMINMPIAKFEVSQSGYGLYVKYWMAGFLAIFAITMAIQFVSYFLDAVADCREEPGKRLPEAPSAH